MRYEYRVESVEVGITLGVAHSAIDSIIEQALRRLGNVGWELVTVIPQGTAYQLYLKRPIMDGKTL